MKYNTHVPNRFVEENAFIGAEPEQTALPTFEQVKGILPSPIWQGRSDVVECYWRAWQLAMGNLRQPAPGSRFVSNFIDTAFNGCLFMWDSAFILMFARYGSRAFNFQRTLDNFYALQHPDGFICRENNEADGEERFERFDPSSTGPNIMGWCEWEYFNNTGDTERLAKVFAPLAAYTQWFRKYRTWPDGSFFASGWGCGMDNQPRLPAGCHDAWDHGHMAWIDTTCQQILADRLLLAMAGVLGRAGELPDAQRELDALTTLVNETMWDQRQAFYVDRHRDGRLSDVKSIGAYWALLAGAVPPERESSFIAHLDDPREFRRAHRVPTLSADHPAFDPAGGYWRGAVWAPTNYMVLRGLTRTGRDDLAHEIGLNHVNAVVDVFGQTGTVFENYAPDSATGCCRRDFVGWTGLPPIAVLFEYVFGLRPDVPGNALTWDIRLKEAHGVDRYPFGPEALLDLHCAARESESQEPRITAHASHPVTLKVRWSGGERTIELKPSGTPR
ncbi:MAG: trehalase family glycosidase [Planctomycetaceae bacterium]|nr:hypothetical protein [Planctomycetaceae bacterium]